jgi:hypothetical protein
MIYDAGIAETVTAINITLDGADPIWLVERRLPPGWKSLLEPWKLLREVLNSEYLTVESVTVKDGMLRIKASSDDRVEQHLVNFVTMGIMRLSAVTCMVCGQRGRRRKDAEHKPCLCATHNVQYFNYLHEQAAE